MMKKFEKFMIFLVNLVKFLGLTAAVYIGGYNLRIKFQVIQPLRTSHHRKSTFVSFYSKFINNFILEDSIYDF
jgi:hypothetical protein